MGDGNSLRVVLSQVKPTKGAVAENVARVRGAVDSDADIVVFPETVLSGYFVEGAVGELALTASRLTELLGSPPDGCRADLAIGFYEEHRHDLYNSMAYLTPGRDGYEVVHVHRKIFLPTYGLFEEGRFVEPGRDVRAFDTRFGRIGMLICEDMWHSMPAAILALDGAGMLLCGSASPARGFTPSPTARPGNLEEWDRIGPRTAREHGVFLFVSQLVGSEGGKLFPGGSTAWAPDGRLLARGPLFEEQNTAVDLHIGAIARARAESPLLSDFRMALPHLRRSLDRVWTGQDEAAPESTDDAGQPAAPAAPIKAAGKRPGPMDAEALAIDPILVESALLEFIREEVVRRRGFSRVVIGVSGGVDSAVSLFLASRALGPDNVFGFRLPYATSSPDSLAHAALAIEATGANERTVSITEAVDGYIANHEPDLSPMRRGNLAARLRSVILFDQSAKLGALPLGTGNKSERLLGYYTWHADDSPPINPIGDLFKTQVWALARHLGVPAEIVDKPASADLIQGIHDEDELGISYHKADPILHWFVRGHTPDALVEMGFDAREVDLVWTRLSSTHWKRELPTVALLSESAIGESYLRPVDY